MKFPGARFFWPLLLVFITLVIAFINYSPGTWLTGWDTLHPELNFPLQLKQLIFGVWRSDQGLGAVAAHSHMVELFRVLLLSLVGVFLPLSDLRYAYILACFILGPLGVYVFLKYWLKSSFPAFLGALFYIFNLGTVQHFYVPFEMFPTQYAALGWLFLFASRGNLKLFALSTILALPMAYASLLWYAYFAALISFVLVLRPKWGKALLIITLVINAFWLLPNWYFLLTHAKDVPGAKTNQMFSEEAFLKNKEFGTLADTVVFKNFLFDWEENPGGVGSRDLMIAWKQHLGTSWILMIGYLAAIFAVIGIALSLRERNRVFVALLPATALSLIMIMNMNPPFGELFGWLRNHSAILRESLRFPFTKLSLILMFSASGYFALFWHWLLSKARVWKVAALGFIVTLIIYGWPMFDGYLISPTMRLAIPQDYFQAFAWFAKQNTNTRIAPFPIDAYAGWQYARWGYQGAGFFWFGVGQSFLARDFDRWMPTNENYYWEVSYALYAKNLPLLEAVLEKYDVRYLLLDGNIINPSSPKALYLDELRELISASRRIKPAASFGQIQIYAFASKKPIKDFVFLTSSLAKVGPAYQWGNLDWGYFENGNYETHGAYGSNETYVYRTLFSGRSQADLEFDPKTLPTNGKPLEIKVEKTLTATNGDTDSVSWNFGDWRHDQGYLITIESRNITGKPLLFWVENLNSRRADMETYLPGKFQIPNSKFQTSYFVLPPMESDGLGYALHFDNVSVGREKTVNELGTITVTPIDYWGLVKQKSGLSHSRDLSYLSDFSVEHPNPAWYRIDLNNNTSATLVLSQSFDPGWVGITVGDMGDMRALGGHTKVNNWANGWRLSGKERIVYLLYWPQVLEFAGFGVLTMFMLGLIIRRGSHSAAACS